MLGDQPPHDDVIDNGTIGLVQQVRVLGASGSDPPKVVAESSLDDVVRLRPPELQASEVADVEQGCGRPAGRMLSQRASLVADRHLPSSEGDHPGTKGTVDGIQG